MTFKKLITITLVLLFCMCSKIYYIKNSALSEELVSSQDISINGVWTIFDKTKDISKLLDLNKAPDCPTFCMNISLHDEKAIIYFYTINKSFEVKIKKIKMNEYEFVNKNKKLGFVIIQRIDNKKIEYGEPIKKYTYMGIKDWDGVLRYTQHGGLDCQWDGELKKCNENEIELCLKDAKKTDDYYRGEKALPADLK